jgi:hypothetical protein
MEEETTQSNVIKKIINKTDNIEVTKVFLVNIKKILEALTERSNLKFDEVLQIGPIFKELDYLLKQT